MLDTNIYEYVDVQEYEYTDVHEYEYTNIYEYELVETQKMKKQKRKKKTFSTGLKCSICCACVAITYRPVLKCTFSTGRPDRY